MGKYEPLRQFLKKQKADRIPLTFKEIEQILAIKLPPSSKRHRAWWSNNPENNVMTREWIAAGFETEEVDTVNEHLVMRRKIPRLHLNPRRGAAASGAKKTAVRKTIIGCMKGMVTFPPDFNPSEPFWSEHDEWETAIIGGLDRK